MEPHKLEMLFEAFFEKRLSSLDHACGGNPLSCLNSNELSVLHILAARRSMIMGHIAEESGLPMSTLTGITDKLTSHGLLERARDSEDRRIIRVALSAEGDEAIRTRFEAKNTVCREIMSRLTDVEQEQFIALMEKIIGT